ncbi:hypothetical protein [Arthrobacter rhombi]|uniref:hypothetical protein n=1 Tax=Arthrobacter rhombi TaxID=71253 RepID=UPI001177B6BF|nr:hypothetical protein [Arthrobacter rhombi]
METLLWVVVPLLVLAAVWWWVARLRRKTSAEVNGSVGPASAREAAGQLGAEAHRAVYRQLAQGNFMGAVQAYRSATGVGVKASIIAVRSLEAHPQVHQDRGSFAQTQEPVQDTRPPAEATGSEASAAAPGEPDANPAAGDDVAGAGPTEPTAEAADPSGPAAQANLDDFTIPEEWAEKFGSGASRKTSNFRISAEEDGVKREFGTDELPPAEFDQFQSLLRDHDLDGAADLLAKFSGLDRDSIRELLDTAPVDGNPASMSEDIADFSFEGDGPEGHVQFSASDLPGEDKTRFLGFVRAGELGQAAEIVHRHTGLPAEMVEQLLTAFGKK